MDKVTRDMCVAQLKNADEHPEKPELMQSAIVSSLIAVLDCQSTTGIRVKRQGLILSGVALILLVSLLCGDAEAMKLICFWRTGAAQ